jgi:hypothetical protein
VRKPAQPVFGNWLNRLLHCSPCLFLLCQSATLPCQKSSMQTVVKPAQPVSRPVQPVLEPVHSPVEQSLNREPLWWKPVLGLAQPVFSQLSPTATSFWGLLYIPLALSLSLFIHFCLIHDFLADLLSNKSIHSSHTQNRISFN